MPCRSESPEPPLHTSDHSLRTPRRSLFRTSGIPCRILTLLFFVCCFASNSAQCPSNCECRWKSGKETVICANLNLTIVPRNIESSTQVLDLTGNLIQALGKHEFHRLNLINLQRLHLANCKIKSIDRLAFFRLINLVELDLSYNLLTFVPSASLEFIAELRELRLSGNTISRVRSNAFAHVPQLVKLEMAACRISHIDLEAFTGLGNTLEVLKLNGNKLVNLNASSITGLISLNSLDLSNNFWNCSCHVRPLRIWLAKQNIPMSIPPTCHFPQRLLHRSWNKLMMEEFACRPRVRPLRPAYIANEMENVTLGCEVTADPAPSVSWSLRGKVIANSTSKSVTVNRRMLDLYSTYEINYLRVFASDTSVSGEYSCVAENRGGRTQVSFNLTLTKVTPTSDAYSFMQNKLMNHALIVVLLLIVALLIILIFMLVFKNKVRLKALRRNSPPEDLNKIELNHRHPQVPEEPSEEQPREEVRHPKQRQYVSLPDAPDPRLSVGSPKGRAAQMTLAQFSPTEERPRRRAPKKLPKTDTDSGQAPGNREAAIRSYYEENFGEVTLQHHVLRKERLPVGSLYTTSKQSSEECTENLAASPSSNSGHKKQTYNTLPRMQSQNSQSSHSRSPLLPRSSQASSTGNSSSSSRNYLTDLEAVTYRRDLASSSERDSWTSLNLAPERGGGGGGYGWRKNPSLPSSPIRRLPRPDPLKRRHSSLSETPIRGILEAGAAGAGAGDGAASHFSRIATTTYDYHAVQLERFLAEYRTLEAELTKMKESCDNFVRSIDQEERKTFSPVGYLDSLSKKSLSACSSDFEPGPRSILKNKPTLNSVTFDSSFERDSFLRGSIESEPEMSWTTDRHSSKTLRRTAGHRYYGSRENAICDSN